jgi:hypothetical protein
LVDGVGDASAGVVVVADAELIEGAAVVGGDPHRGVGLSEHPVGLDELHGEVCVGGGVPPCLVGCSSRAVAIARLKAEGG